MKKCNQCSDGGFVALQTKILEDGKIQCPACSELLSVCGFQPEDLSRFIARLEENGPQSNAEPDGKETEAKAAKADDANEKEATDPASKEEQADAFAYVRQFAPDIELLQPGDYGKKFGYRCRICTSKNYPQGKIGELHAAKPYAVKHFLEQHMNSVTHQRQLAAKKKASEEDLVPCAGISVKDPRSGHLYALRQEFSLWSQFTNFEAHAKHKYRREANSEEGDVWYITSASCKGRCKPLGDAVRPVCDACFALTDSHAVPRNVARFGVKYYAACLLSARLFLPKADQNAVELEIQQSGLYQKDQKKMDNILRMRKPVGMESFEEADNSGVSVIQLTPLVKVHEEYWYEEDEPRWTIRLLRWRFEQRISEEEMGEWQIASLEEKWFREKLYTKKR
eukprot:g8152.t1